MTNMCKDMKGNPCIPGRCRTAMTAIGLLLLRVCFGGLLAYQHGWAKFSGFSAMAESFPDPLGVGHKISLGLVVGAEFFCALLLIPGLLTRLAVIPLIINMGVAFFVFHSADPLEKKELALLYLIPFVAIFFCGPGPISIDGLIRKYACKPAPEEPSTTAEQSRGR
jgi:putative oxidoreductase